MRLPRTPKKIGGLKLFLAAGAASVGASLLFHSAGVRVTPILQPLLLERREAAEVDVQVDPGSAHTVAPIPVDTGAAGPAGIELRDPQESEEAERQALALGRVERPAVVVPTDESPVDPPRVVEEPPPIVEEPPAEQPPPIEVPPPGEQPNEEPPAETPPPAPQQPPAGEAPQSPTSEPLFDNTLALQRQIVAQIHTIEQQIGGLGSEASQLMQAIDAREAQVATQTQQIEGQIDGLECVIDDAPNSLRKQIRAQIVVLQRQIAALEAQLANELGALQDRVVALQSQISALEGQLLALEAQLAKLESSRPQQDTDR